ncbi:hypothetical protein L227DRAFT_11615 [Lentinus tigrinus ALCF2SS1-6]|uniref:Uncharacterized protein n=1 Tax=Lentinus tigrinus ALCF2SS1-6 TaxID=1328759 RepID=A0A5C2ST68_9APHY|nr:hypothetical protein L227DRAFT_11615 [Lentinus tigrinus ALCF2SS1-6]
MPRLIPRLLRSLEHARSLPRKPPRRTAPQRRKKDPPITRVFTRPEEVGIAPTGRRQSILLDRKAVRLIYRHARYEREKAPAPQISVSKTQWAAKQRRGRAPLGVIPKEMTREERQFFANPYLRMLGSPLRKCLVSEYLLPRDLLIGMTPMLLPNERGKTAFLPAGISNPRDQTGGKMRYILCWKSVVEHLKQTGIFKRWRTSSASEISMHALIVQQIGHELRMRVLLELDILEQRLRRVQQPSSPPLLRWLTRGEWNAIKTNGMVPFDNAIAVLVVPPLNKDLNSKNRPKPHDSSEPPEDLLDPSPSRPQSLPLSVLYPTTAKEDFCKVDVLDLLPPARVPIYNGVPLFPSRKQRAALRAALGRVLTAEHFAKRGLGQRSLRATEDSDQSDLSGQVVKGDQKASHAVLVCSDERTIFRGDTVPLAIALWRLRMWEASEDDKDAMINWTMPESRTP